MSSAAVSAASSCSAKPKEELPLPKQEREMEQERRAEECSSTAAAVSDQEERLKMVDRKPSEASLCATANEEEETEEEDDDEEAAAKDAIELGPRVSIKEQLDKDKDDESLRRWKEQLLGSVDLSSVGETLEPDVKITGLSILSPGRPDMVLPLPPEPKSKEPWFTLKEGSAYRLKFTFAVAGNIVSGLCYTNTVWKTGIRVDSTKEMLGTFSPQAQPYTYLTPEEATPSGIFARGSYSARTKFLDDYRKCYLEMDYNFDIRRDWPSSR
ncbi:Rho GDP-dissociation inhibitor 1 [Dichanthelium oligosanthes]|uniref:Rho GDP-dissociation inhibitor 1 n=1 Tax=Dichanthelium oligosanthes TaxID=888268 RepID=A0A1E5V2I1_9POAL|nr:Rho GDP-dissociation inhibitor 1 [Dichanthelium oligosanthes]